MSWKERLFYGFLILDALFGASVLAYVGITILFGGYPIPLLMFGAVLILPLIGLIYFFFRFNILKFLFSKPS